VKSRRPNSRELPSSCVVFIGEEKDATLKKWDLVRLRSDGDDDGVAKGDGSWCGLSQGTWMGPRGEQHGECEMSTPAERRPPHLWSAPPKVGE